LATAGRISDAGVPGYESAMEQPFSTSPLAIASLPIKRIRGYIKKFLFAPRLNLQNDYLKPAGNVMSTDDGTISVVSAKQGKSP
jgi:hypothetical protein